MTILLAAALALAADFPAERQDRIARDVEAAFQLDRAPAISVAIQQGDQIYRRAWGFTDVENDVEATPASRFRIGSIVKSMTAVAALRLVEEGKIDLDAPVHRYCGAFPDKPQLVTTRLLLGHLGGIRHYRGSEFFSTRAYTSVAESLDIFRNDPLVHAPGSAYLYTTYGYNVVGCAVEGAAGEPFYAVLKRLVFDPAGMETAAADEVPTIIANRARGYSPTRDGILRNAGLTDNSNKVPGGGVVASADDVVRFGSAMLEGKLVRPDTRRTMWTSMRTTAGKETGYGMGWSVVPEGAYHTGGSVGFVSILYINRDTKTVVSILWNSDLIQSDRLALARKLAE
jgi:serine beta-lactamase-like protein LACTB